MIKFLNDYGYKKSEVLKNIYIQIPTLKNWFGISLWHTADTFKLFCFFTGLKGTVICENISSMKLNNQYITKMMGVICLRADYEYTFDAS